MDPFNHLPGKYNDICTLARLSAEAKGAVVIILEGRTGNGFSIQCQPGAAKILPDLLRVIAADIERGIAKHAPGDGN